MKWYVKEPLKAVARSLPGSYFFEGDPALSFFDRGKLEIVRAVGAAFLYDISSGEPAVAMALIPVAYAATRHTTNR